MINKVIKLATWIFTTFPRHGFLKCGMKKGVKSLPNHQLTLSTSKLFHENISKLLQEGKCQQTKYP